MLKLCDASEKSLPHVSSIIQEISSKRSQLHPREQQQTVAADDVNMAGEQRQEAGVKGWGQQ